MLFKTDELKRHRIVIDNKTAAYALVYIRSEDYFLEDLSTKPEYRKQGLASKLMDMVIETYYDKAIALLADPFDTHQPKGMRILKRFSLLMELPKLL